MITSLTNKNKVRKPKTFFSKKKKKKKKPKQLGEGKMRTKEKY